MLNPLFYYLSFLFFQDNLKVSGLLSWYAFPISENGMCPQLFHGISLLFIYAYLETNSLLISKPLSPKIP